MPVVENAHWCWMSVLETGAGVWRYFKQWRDLGQIARNLTCLEMRER